MSGETYKSWRRALLDLDDTLLDRSKLLQNSGDNVGHDVVSRLRFAYQLAC